MCGVSVDYCVYVYVKRSQDTHSITKSQCVRCYPPSPPPLVKCAYMIYTELASDIMMINDDPVYMCASMHY